ncbi:uncharacterized protein LOC126666995 [Mercurialis annua]|uniref:uncharacterized protein LOC126666995 n=1 Tax=Mercurialis annua TaxID=3986 RepID=UPI0021600234|nr:uncharacterized protein LOC126666995 [Mercurialis annua]
MPTSSSSSTRIRQRSNEYTSDENRVLWCNCRVSRIAPLYTSWTEKNPGRRFYGCVNYKNGGCNFFEWHDKEMTGRAQHVINNLIAENEIIMDRRCKRRNNYGEDVDTLWQEFKLLKISEEKRNEDLFEARKKMKIAYAIAALSWGVLILYFLG